jgi:hypothetical protein
MIKEDDKDENQQVKGLVQRVNVNTFRYHLLRWMVNRYIAFIKVEDKDFRDILLLLN